MIDEFIGTTLAGKYKIEELLNEGEFGNTYRAEHLMMENPVTVNILSPALAVDDNIVEGFSLEARTISRLSHPNILNVTDFGKDEETVYIVTEFAEGKTLKETIRAEGAFTVERSVRITRQIAAALSAAHASEIIHKHLTSDRIQLIPMGEDSELVKVLDFGSFEIDNTRDFENEQAFEELAYLSPEQCTQESEADERSDIYSLGIIFFETLTGEVPFSADTATDLMMKHSQSPPPPLISFRDDIPEEVEPILLNALAKNPEKRYQTAAAFADDLSEASREENEDDTIVIPRVSAAAAGAGVNSSWKTAFIVLAGISILAFGFILLTNTKQNEPNTIVKVDENGKPVQPLNPATGLSEQNLPNMDQFPSNSLADLDPTLLQPDMPSVGGGGDGSYGNPWDNGPPSASSPIVGPGGERVTLGEDGSIFMPDDDGTTLVYVPKPEPEDVKGKKNKEGKDAEKKDPPKKDPKKDGKDAEKKDPPKKDGVDKGKKADKPKPKDPKPKVPGKSTPKNKTKTAPTSSSKKQPIKSGDKQDS